MFGTILWVQVFAVTSGPIQPPPMPDRVPVVVEEAPAPRPRETVEVAPPARPVQSAESVRSAPVTQPGFRLRLPGSGLNVNPGGPPAPPATELLPPPSFADPGGFAVPTPAPGDIPMPAHPTRQTVLSAVLGAALAFAPASTAVAQDKDAKKTPPDLTAIKTQLDQIQANLNDALFGKENSTNLAEMGLIKRLSDIESQLSKIHETLKRIEARLNDPSRRTAEFGPAMPGVTVGRGYVRIVNDYPTEMSMLVNGRSHRVPPGQAVTVDVPPGSFTYELLHAGSEQKTTTVRDGETMTLRIR
jgi:hypothetical protein